MMVTSLTTMVAFLATGCSSIMTISSFGIFAAIIVPVNYFQSIFLLPAYYVTYEKHIANLFEYKNLI